MDSNTEFCGVMSGFPGSKISSNSQPRATPLGVFGREEGGLRTLTMGLDLRGISSPECVAGNHALSFPV
jgi:hypothetical protein